jgi:redox-sensitive bicupin YhaK (pirin superfamily)
VEFAAERRTPGSRRAGYLYGIVGTARLNDDDDITTGDAVTFHGPERVGVHAAEETELILVDLPRHHEPVGVWSH